MSTPEVTPESLRATAKWLRDRGAIHAVDTILCNWAGVLEREQRPLPTEPGWYPTIVVERGGESCTGALLTDEGEWITSELVLGCHHHEVDSRFTAIRWAEQDAAHGTPNLTPEGEHPEPGTRGLLPVVLVDSGIWQSTAGWLVCSEYQGRRQEILADPRPDGAHE